MAHTVYKVLIAKWPMFHENDVFIFRSIASSKMLNYLALHYYVQARENCPLVAELLSKSHRESFIFRGGEM